MAEIKAGLPQSSLKPMADSGSMAAEEKYQNALDYITQALLAREGNNQQQQLLAISQGLLTPGPTGSFGESVGHAAGNVLKVQKEQQAAGLENAKMRLQLAQAEREQAQKTEGMKFLSGMQGASDQEKPQLVKGDASGPGIMINGKVITPTIIGQLMYSNPALGKSLETMYKLALEDIVVQQGGVASKLTGKYTPFGGKPMVARNVPGKGVVEMPEQDAMELDEARRSGNSRRYYEIVERNTMPMPAPGQQITTPSIEGKEPTEAREKAEKPAAAPMTKASVEAKSAAEKKEAEVGAESRAKQTAAVRDAGKAATGLIPIYDRAESILNRPGLDFNKIMGVLEKGGALDAIGSLVEEALRVGNFTVGIPAIRKIIGQTGAPPELIAAAAELGQLLAMTQFEQRKGLGSGTSVSNFEQMMVNAMGPSLQDTLMSFRPKLQFMRNKAEFERDLAKAIRKAGIQYEDFEDTQEFQDMFDAYKQKQMGIAYGGSQGQKPKPSAGASSSAQITAEDVKRRLGAK